MDELLMWVRSVISTTPERWQRMTQVYPIELLTAPPAPKEWSAVECLVHIIETEKVFNTRLEAFLAGHDFPAVNPDQQGSKRDPSLTLSGLAAEFALMRQASLKALEAITLADLDRCVRHAELGPVTLGQMLNEWAGHDLMHTVQAERAMMQPFIEGCGSWQIYFKDHKA